MSAPEHSSILAVVEEELCGRGRDAVPMLAAEFAEFVVGVVTDASLSREEVTTTVVEMAVAGRDPGASSETEEDFSARARAAVGKCMDAWAAIRAEALTQKQSAQSTSKEAAEAKPVQPAPAATSTSTAGTGGVAAAMLALYSQVDRGAGDKGADFSEVRDFDGPRRSGALGGAKRRPGPSVAGASSSSAAAATAVRRGSTSSTSSPSSSDSDAEGRHAYGYGEDGEKEEEDDHAPPLVLDVTVQTSRFHEAVGVTVNLHGITISVGGERGHLHDSDNDESDGSDGNNDDGVLTAKRELLTDADLSLAQGTRYALIGRNGSGKSIFLKVLASGALFDPDTQLQLRVQLVTQSFAPPPRPDWTVQDEVNRPPFGYDLRDALDANKRALRRSDLRSGTRGKEAREIALALEAKEKEKARKGKGGKGAQRRKSKGGSSSSSDASEADDDTGNASAATSAVGAGAGSSAGVVAAVDGLWPGVDYDDPPSMSAVMSAFKALNIPADMLSRPYSTLSGGWRMRITLAKALIYEPNILLLDEPTNHLDIAGINHLISLLKSPHFFPESIIIFVSHDLHFVNDVAQSCIEIRENRFVVSKGNWDTLQRERADRKKFTDRYAAEQEKAQERLLSSIEASMRTAGKDDKLRKQLAGRREKALERGVGMMRNSKGHRFRKHDAENAGWHLKLLNDVELVKEEKPVKFRFEPPSYGRSGAGAGAGGAATTGASLLAVDGLSFQFPARKGNTAAGGGFSLELRDLNLSVGERLVLLGPNGHGKSTLLRLLVGELVPSHGSVRILAPTYGYFEQHAVSRLGGEKRTALAYVMETRKKSGHALPDEEDAVRKSLGSFGLGPHVDTPVALLSGGQRVALEFVVIALRRPALLLLDEPSAHLDLQAREGLGDAIAAFTEGAVLFISHDVGFIERAKPTRALVCEGGRFRPVEEEDWKAVALAL
jgi:ATP-binding cassette subfamily F protein 3